MNPRIVAALIIPALMLGGCAGSKAPRTEGRQVSARNACQNLVRDQLGTATFRNTNETWTTKDAGTADAVTTYIATGKADTSRGSFTYRCTSVVGADLELKTKLVKLEL